MAPVDTAPVFVKNGVSYIDPEVYLHRRDRFSNYAADPRDAVGWTTYVRWSHPEGSLFPFEVNDIRDFGTYADARAYADRIAGEFETSVREY